MGTGEHVTIYSPAQVVFSGRKAGGHRDPALKEINWLELEAPEARGQSLRSEPVLVVLP